ncbi:glycoside hydrolase family 5 protein [Phlegmacium glaucopus]|nr:glycoside hydrolase family 5 protein [Phlegmacium glaucopus]
MPKFLNRLLAAVICSSSLITTIYALTPGFPYGSQKVRGVNLGGWLILEPWITPSIFDNSGDPRIIDEYTFGQYQDRDQALATLKQHWDTFITESDFQAIAAAGLNHVRLPIGYWAFEVSGGEPFVQGQLPYLIKAVNWAKANGLKLLIDLYGAPGSQNGFINSGQIKPNPEWHTRPSYIQRTSAIIQNLTAIYKDMSEVVSIIAPLNEPAGFYSQDLLTVAKEYYYSSYQSIRFPYATSSRESNTMVMIHDAFQPLSYWNDFMPSPQYDGVILDTHIYDMFSAASSQKNHSQHIQFACSQALDSPLYVVVGEWVPVATDCAKYLNGRGVGARYDGTYPGSTRVGSCQGLTGQASTFSDDYKTFLRQYWEAQVITYEKAQGWVQWTWRADNAEEWSYQAGLANGWIPCDPTDLKYPNICG